MSTSALQQAQGFLDFVNQSPTPYHVVQTVKSQLKHNGFIELSERDNWAGKIKKNSKYFVTRNSSSIIAFGIGGKYQPGNGFSMVGGHTDSPVLRIKPISKQSKEGYHQIGVETYGGGIWHTWFDRDLSIAGRVFVNYPDTGKCIAKLVKIDKPLLRIPTLAIHLNKDRYVNFEFNKETQFKPIAGLQTKTNDLEKNDSCCKGEELSDEQFQSVKSIVERHNKELLDLISEQLSIKPTQIEDFELVLYDTQKSCLGGLKDEFIFSPRLDNQVTCYCATQALVNSTSDAQLANNSGIQLVSLFDHEEIGSLSAQGADSSFLPNIVDRLTKLTANPEVDLKGELPSSYFLTTMAKSFMISSDMAHGVNPNYTENYESYNVPHLNDGPVIKINANQRYVTNSAGIVLLKKIGNMAKTPLQLFVVRNDSPCGSTIGPMISAKLGVRTLDLGNPQLSMHSIRETCGSEDIEKLILLFESYFENYNAIEDSIFVDGVDC
jgi:aspartyl aminopeptidase